MENSKTGLVVLSGGMDSTTLLYEYKEYTGLAVSFNYGSKHNAREISFAMKTCNMLGIPHKVVDLTKAMSSFKSALLDRSVEVPEGHYAEDNMSKTVVPFRNGIMLSIAAGIAESNGLNTVYIANHFGDDAQYPDCRQGFITPMNEAVQAGTDYKVRIEAPYTTLTKEDIADIGADEGVTWSTTWSCYKGGAIHCGKCGTCVERIWALRHHQDDTQYEDYEYAVKVLKEKGEWDV
jgi:7-cyano-7-deazaguanine synthase